MNLRGSTAFERPETDSELEDDLESNPDSNLDSDRETERRLDDDPRPGWMIEAHEALSARPAPELEEEAAPPRSHRSLIVLGAFALVVTTAMTGALGWYTLTNIDQDSTPSTAAPRSDDNVPESELLVSSADLPQGEEPDRMSIRIESPTPDQASDQALPTGTPQGATATVREDGLVYFEGAFRSEAEADRFISRAVGVFGADSIVENHTIDPSAPSPSASDVTLDKPVLFETGSATIHPDYVPFLEACGDILRLNPHITMSIAAFTDTLGDEDFNLDLSQQRAQAIIDFYRNLDVASDQLVGTGFGEGDPVADNNTEEGRSENRRVMLELLNVMSDDPEAGTGS